MFSALFHYITFASIGAFHLFKNWKSPSVGFGQCLLCSAASYFQSGGHEGIKKEVVENMALVEKMNRQGEFIRCMSGQGALSMRMYPKGLKSLIKGWSKSFASGAGKTEVIYLFLVSLWLTSMINYVLFLPTLGNQHALLAIGSYACLVGLLFNSLRKIGSFTFFSLCLFPIHVLFFLCLFVWSFIQTAVRKKVKWKERSVSIEEKKKKVIK
jgi:4,4'-diaponeurosporenoate glycosyltransferase